MSIFIVIAMYGLWSSTFAIAKAALAYAPPIFLTGARMLLAAVLIGSYLLARRNYREKLLEIPWIPVIFLGIFSIYLTNVLEFWALQYLSAAKTCFIYSFCPIFTAFFSYLHFGEKMNSRKWVGLGLGTLGIVPVLLLQGQEEQLFSLAGIVSWPALAMVGASLTTVYGWVLLRLIVKGKGVSPLVANGGSMWVGGVLAIVHSLCVESWSPTPIAAGGVMPFLGWIGLMALVSNIVCYNLYGVLLKKFTATFLSFMGLLSPLFASFHGWLWLGESPAWQIWASTTIVSVGLWLVYATELKQGYILSSEPVTAGA